MDMRNAPIVAGDLNVRRDRSLAREIIGESRLRCAA
jgi:hypothetical protein